MPTAPAAAVVVVAPVGRTAARAVTVVVEQLADWKTNPEILIVPLHLFREEAAPVLLRPRLMEMRLIIPILIQVRAAAVAAVAVGVLIMVLVVAPVAPVAVQ